jgi:hypothetical protein
MIGQNVLFEDILDAIMLEESEPSYSALARWSERYPEHAEALAEFFATWAVQTELPQEIAVDEERLANIAVSHALNILHHRDKTANHEPKAGASTATPRLLATCRAAGISDEELASRAGLDETIIVKLDLHRITNIPHSCFEVLAAILGIAAERIEEMATGPPLAAKVRYKAKGKPVPTTEDFADAVRNSSLPEESQRFWLETVLAEGGGEKE